MAFKLLETKELPDIQSQALIYEHEGTGAKILRLKNEDRNKAFTIGFRTPPYSDNGITHIIEHSVLNGSEKYPSKEPFVDLIKGSLNTFVNALTFSDKTIYPVSSTHQKDFMNLMSVYMDAVFKPNMRDNELILQQEGWHYHLENAEDDLIYKGVVYNEMKGATASADAQLYYNLIPRALYPETIYRHESGGHPRAITDLTFQEFVDYHSKYYHPSNSLTVLYGDLEDQEAFDKLEEYFADFDCQEEQIAFDFVPEVPSQTSLTETYSITAGDDPADKTYLALAWHTELPDHVLDSYGMKVLSQILFGNNEAPLKKALIEAEIGGDINGDDLPLGYPSAFVISAKYSEAEKMDRFKEVTEQTLRSLVEEGIPEDLVTAALNKITFSLKESAISESNPRGVMYAIGAYSTWLYDQDPYASFEFTKYLDQIRDLAKDRYFEKLIQTKLLDNPVRIDVALVPEAGKNDRIEAETHRKLQEYKAQLSEEQVQELVDSTQALIQRQETPDTSEDLNKIPSLSREDLTTELEEYPLEVEDFEEFNKFYFAEQFTSGIDYLNIFFDISDFPAEDYPVLGYLANQLTQLSTANYSLRDLRVNIDQYTGGIRASISIFETEDGIIKPYFVMQGKALNEFTEKLIALMKEVLVNSRFDNANELMNNTQRLLSNFEEEIDFSSHVLAMNRAVSQLKASVKLSEYVRGIDYFNHLKDKRQQLKSEAVEELTQQLTQVLAKLLNKHRISALYIGEQERSSVIKSLVSQAFADLTSEEIGPNQDYQPGSLQNEAFITAQDVNYVGFAANAKGFMEYQGSSLIMSMIASFDYLWNAVRVQGGAYGVGFRHERNGYVDFFSYRDPNIVKTIEAYQQVPDYVTHLSLDEESLLKHIIGALGTLIRPLAAYDKGMKAFSMLQRGISHQDNVKLKEELLATKPTDIQSLGAKLSPVIEQGTLAVIGNKAQIESEKELFDQIYELY